VILVLVGSTYARRQGAAEKPVFFTNFVTKLYGQGRMYFLIVKVYSVVLNMR
jgi:hypothetical protein